MIMNANILLLPKQGWSFIRCLPVWASQFTTSNGSQLEESDALSSSSLIIEEKDLLRHSLDQSGTGLHVLDLIDRASLEPDRTLYHILFKKCTLFNKLKEGQLVHAHLLNSRFKHDLVIQNTILNMYAKCGNLGEARKVFDQMPVKDVVTWTALITGYSQHDRPKDALLLFPQMLTLGFRPNHFTLSSLLKASGVSPSDSNGRLLHAFCIKYGYSCNVYVGSALLDMYARSGHLEEALFIFDGLPSRNEVSWNALIAGCARKGDQELAFSFFSKMLRENIQPTQFTYSIVLSACASIGSLEQGKWVHALLIKSGAKLVDFVGNTLLGMYAKSGSIEDARKVFDGLVKRDVVSWNSMLAGYAQHGLGNIALLIFRQMLIIGVAPNDITFLCVLTACSHAGLLAEGLHYFNLMRKYKEEAWAE
ncbi:pentatricopeptide repeat-containing protein, putative [Ricinus communis]|uniref:Pentatricopeptide repeat-containing protein, putative n=1 Tax=Ricinus communis TaxID=3988 RepID=B9SGV8_RICCO|nr:pentatricopeptide repeat-containing protein, putative [Ricinus communis]